MFFSRCINFHFMCQVQFVYLSKSYRSLDVFFAVHQLSFLQFIFFYLINSHTLVRLEPKT